MAIVTGLAMRNARANSGRGLPDATQMKRIVMLRKKTSKTESKTDHTECDRALVIPCVSIPIR
jgi:hypothetical protein